MSKINEQTFVSISVVAGILLAIFGLGQSYARLEEHEVSIQDVENQQKDTDKKLTEILQALARIEERLAQSKK